MVIYNTTYNVDTDIHKAWLVWVKAEFIPRLYDTGVIVKHIFSKILVEEDMGGITYSLQLFTPSMIMLRAYQDNHKAILESEMIRKFNGKFVSFNTILEVQDD